MKNYKEFLLKNETAQTYNNRLKIFVDEYRRYHNDHQGDLKVLDIGCGKKVELYDHKIAGDDYYGCDFYESIDTRIDHYTRIDLNEDSLVTKYDNQKFDVIFCGEVIEHLFSPDDLIDEIKVLMHSESILVVSSPNLGYWANRLVLLFGISPFFLENSSEAKLGRKLMLLGQYNKTEGHIRLFTYGALKDFFRLKELRVIKVIPTYIWNFFLDKIVCCFSKSLAPTNIFILKKY